MQRKCEECPKPLVRREGESITQWKRRRYCSKACAIAVSKRHLKHLAK